MSDLKDLYFVLKNDYNINVYYRNKDNVNITKYNCSFTNFLIKNLIMIIILLILNLFIKNKYINILFYFIIILIILKIFKNYIRFYDREFTFENKYNKIHFHKLNLNQLKTGDIIQQRVSWYEEVLNFSFCLDYFSFNHNTLVIKYNNKLYGLHISGSDFGYMIDSIKFYDNQYLEIFDLEEYLYYQELCFKKCKYRLATIKHPLNNNNIFNIVKNHFLDNHFKFNALLLLKYNSVDEYINNGFNYTNCWSFILKILYLDNKIILLNYNNTTSNDIIFLPYWSNGLYNNITFVIY